MATEAEHPTELALAHLDSLPTLPPVAVKLLQATAADESSARDIVQIVRNDQSLTARILSLVQSAGTGVASRATTLEQAVPLLGFARLRSVVLATSVFACFAPPGKPRPGALDLRELWKHALAVASAARRLAQQVSDPALHPEDAFVAGLLHDLGKVALSAVFPKAYERAVGESDRTRGDIADCERAVLGVDHTVAGRRLAERWRLPQNLRDVIWLHHLAAEVLPASVANARLVGVVQLADTIAREQRVGYSGNHVFYEGSSRLGERLGFTPQQLDAVVAQLADDVAEQTALLGLGGETSGSVYLQAITRANTELGQLNEELRASNRRLAIRARYFDAMTAFDRDLRNWADPASVVAAIASAAALALQRPTLLAFGVRDDGRLLDVCGRTANAPASEPRSQRPAPDAVRWLSADVRHSAELVTGAPAELRGLWMDAMGAPAEGTPWLLPIRHDGRMTGGILYLSELDEPARLAEEADELRAFLTSVGLGLGRAHAQAAAQRLSEDLAETNRRLQQMQVQLLRSRTLSMIAEMAAGAGHELNSPLTVISGRAQMLAAGTSDVEAKRVLDLIAAKAHECSGIVSELMDFARPRPPQMQPMNLPALMEEVRREFLQRGNLSNTQIRVEAPGPHASSPMMGDHAQIKCVLSELVRNAVDAVAANAGTIVLGMEVDTERDQVEVTVSDNGCGMPPAVMQRAFDPFFSHRHAGRGRGLGLPRAHRIVEAHGGRIWLESQPGEGTQVHVVLPRAREAV